MPQQRECPYLTPVVADRLFMYPTSAYCRRPGCKIRVPSAATVARVCSEPEHKTCAGFLASTRGEAVR